jgi:hypothetical protein
MNTNNFYAHPKPLQYQLEQWGALLLLGLMLLAFLGLLWLAFAIPAPLFVVMALLLIVLAAPVMMLLVVSTSVKIEDAGLRIFPRFGREAFIAWEDVQRVAAYPLLPGANQEVLRQALVGRKNYREAEGIMLIIPKLPAPYRIAGFFAGQNGAPILAFSNRSHSDYYALKAAIEEKTIEPPRRGERQV